MVKNRQKGITKAYRNDKKDVDTRHTLYPLSCSLKWCSMDMSGLYLFCFFFYHSKSANHVNP